MTADRGREPDLRSLVGRTIDGRYRLGALVGEGNFGGVFASRQQLLGLSVRRVAIKVSKRTGIDLMTARELFADAFALAHAMDAVPDADARRHLVHVYDVGLAAGLRGRAFVVMEYVEGTTLAKRMDGYHQVPARSMTSWVRQTCEALAALHRLDPPVLHRDIKPDNLLLGRDGVVRLVDFGLAARMVAGGLASDVAGATEYMAPESARGSSVPASDVYSLGLVLYEGLTGEHPFARLGVPPDAPVEQVLQARRKVTLRRPSLVTGVTSRALDDLVLACVGFDPEGRPADGGALLEALREIDRPSQREPVPTPLERGRVLRREGDLEGARATLEDGLVAPRRAGAAEFALLRELAAVLTAQGDDDAAGKRLARAWKLTAETAILESRADRIGLLEEASAAFARAGNAFQAERYARLAAREAGVTHRV